MGFRPARSAIPAKGDRGKSESAMQRSYFEMHRTRDIAAVARCPCGLGRPTEPVPRRGWKWWISGNGGLPDFHKGAGSDFQPTCWKFRNHTKAAMFGFPRPFSRTSVYWWCSTTRPRILPPLFKSLSAALAWSAGRGKTQALAPWHKRATANAKRPAGSEELSG